MAYLPERAGKPDTAVEKMIYEEFVMDNYGLYNGFAVKQFRCIYTGHKRVV